MTAVQEINGRWKDVVGLICYEYTWVESGVSIRTSAMPYDPDMFAADSPDMKEWHYPQ